MYDHQGYIAVYAKEQKVARTCNFKVFISVIEDSGVVGCNAVASLTV